MENKTFDRQGVLYKESNMKNYTDEELKADIEKTIGIRAKDIEKVLLVGMWHIRFHAFGNDFYYYLDANSKPILKQDAFDWPRG